MGLVGVAEQDVVAVPGEVGADGPADGPGADDRQLHCSASTPPLSSIGRLARTDRWLG
jgi:hypothetical protein